MTSAGKDTIYIDIDDEITSIIDKVHSSAHQLVALVLPKRASMLQSSVNMKLLKRAADTAKKQLVLITSEAGLLPLAGAVGLPVARTLQSKPEIPDAGSTGAAAEAVSIVDEPAEEFDPAEVADTPIGALAGLPIKESATPRAKPELAPRPIPTPESVAVGAAATAAAVEDDTIDIDDAVAEDAAVDPTTKDRAKQKAGKKPRVPNFEKFRLRLILGGALLIVLIVAWILANIILPKAIITVATNASTVNTSVTATLDSGAKAIDPAKLVVPAVAQQSKKTQTQQVAASGQKNTGTTATGTITVINCGPSPETIAGGSGFSANSLTFISQRSITVPPSDYSFGGKTCKNNGTATVEVTALAAGTAYNLAPTPYSITGNPAYTTAQGSQMSGGTDNVIKTVTQADVDSAKQKLTAQDTTAVKTELQTALQGLGLYPIPATFNAGDPAITTSANPGDQADTVTVTQTTIYVMFGAHQSDLQQLIATGVNKQIDTSKQAILDDGFSKASFNVVSQSGGSAQVTMQTAATAGPHLNVDSLKKQIVGKKSGDVKSIIGLNPGVTGVTVHFSPFWVSSTPKKLNKITITIEQPKVANAKP